MNNLAYVETEKTDETDTGKPLLVYKRGEDKANKNAQLVELIVDYLLASGSMPA